MYDRASQSQNRTRKIEIANGFLQLFAVVFALLFGILLS